MSDQQDIASAIQSLVEWRKSGSICIKNCDDVDQLIIRMAKSLMAPEITVTLPPITLTDIKP